MANFPKNHKVLYFDGLVRTQKAETLLAMIHATYHTKNAKYNDDVIKEEISKRLVNAYNLYRDNVKGRESGAGTFDGDYGAFMSQYTIGLEMAIWKNSNLDLSDLAIKVAKNQITIRDYLDIIFLNYVQPINEVNVHPLFQILKYLKSNNCVKLPKDEFYKALGLKTEEAPGESVNALFNFLISTNYFREQDKQLLFVSNKPIDYLLEKCNTVYIGAEGYIKATSELNTEEAYDKYISSEKVVKMPEITLERKDSEMINRSPRTNKTNPLNAIVYGAPGTGKTYSMKEYAVSIIEGRKVRTEQLSAEERQSLNNQYKRFVENGQIVFTTFHQSYGYEDFIQGLRPETNNGAMDFVTMDGVFKRIADKAMQDTTNNYVIIIDEINRGNISKVFGELITLIEDDKRWGEKEQLSVILPSGQEFAVPNNLYIVGTMNSADKSIALIDTALRRRFDFIEVAPNAELVEDETLRKVLEQINAVLRKELDSSDLLIGHAYFIGKEANELASIMNRNIIPLLYEYFYDNEKKVKDTLTKALVETDVKIKDNVQGRLKVE